ncbi:MAG: sulfite oxidase-like oxidoreductase [Actinomycetota bacterium]|nr:sulfite oxidase-like oxidoreductase [Actinomycetota bacterium]
MEHFTRGFSGRARPARERELPPGQYDVGEDWPVLTAEATPRLDPATFSVAIGGLVASPVRFSLAELDSLEHSTYRGAIHCVTTWSKFGMFFEGVSLDTLFQVASPLAEARFGLVRSHTGYTTNLPLSDLEGGRALIATRVNGEPLSVEHGGPARLVVPHLYFWKSAKWVAEITLAATDVPGFWEQNGYHDRGDPWQEQRYQGD